VRFETIGVAVPFTGATFNGTAQSVTLSNGNLTVTWGATSGGVPSTAFYSAGKFYMEFTYGGTTPSTSPVGFAKSGVPPNQIDFNAGGCCYQGGASGNLISNGSNVGNSIGVPASGDVIGVAVDLTALLFWMRRNGGNWNGSGTANPATGVGGVSFTAGAYAPMISFGSSGAARTTTGNLGQSAFGGAVPAGFTSGWPA
jgi:hypothetical protein